MNEILKKKLAVIMGGTSAERDISLKSGGAILNALLGMGANVIGIDAANSLIETLRKERIDLAFIALHGKFGEDGTVQGLLEAMNIPYTGSGILASSLAMDKVMSKRVFKSVGIPTPNFMAINKKTFTPSFNVEIPFPLVVKPSREGSTFGISILNEPGKLKNAIDEAFAFDTEVLIEEYIGGMELTVGILGDEALPVIDIIPNTGFYDFESKYTKGATEYIVPARLESNTASTLRKLALDAHNALGCSGVSRVDFRMDKKNYEPYVLEVNTIPGMTETSLLPKAAAVAGYSFEDLVMKILSFALL